MSRIAALLQGFFVRKNPWQTNKNTRHGAELSAFVIKNTPTPLIREGITHLRGESTFFINVMLVFTVHLALIGGMLLQGCKETNIKEASADPISPHYTANPDQKPPTAIPASFSNAVANQPHGAQPQAQAHAKQAAVRAATVVPNAHPADTNAKVYVIGSGDTLGAIARKNGISLKALLDANPGINPKKIQVGQKLKVPGLKVG